MSNQNSANSPSSTTLANATLNPSATATTSTDPLDAPSASEIAATIAHMANLPEATAVQNEADTYSIELAYAISTTNQSNIIPKAQVVSTGLKNNQDIQTYTVQPGDTVSKLAVQFGITSNSIRWSNGLSNYAESLSVGSKLEIPPVNGIVYTVKAGDTPTSLARKYEANAQQIIAFNDDELTGLKVGQKIVIPNGKIPNPVYISPYSYYYGSSWGWGSGALGTYGFNGYDPGNCTWYAANKRIQAGHPLPTNLGNASSWLDAARAEGIPTGRTPQAGAVIWFNPPGAFDIGGPIQTDTAYGHVGYVDSVSPNGTAHISEMDVYGLYSMGYETLSPGQATQYHYIY